jgi:hypothetical protein
MNNSSIKPLNFFIIFHDKLFKDNVPLLPCFTWVAVNEKIPKQIPDWLPKDSLIKEYEMKIHSPLYQMLNFYQNSVFFHLYWNKDLIKSKYIGFGQYDMTFNKEDFEKILSDIKDDTADKIIPTFLYPFEALCPKEVLPIWEEIFMKPYNSFYSMNHTLDSLKGIPLALLHTFIMPTWFFLHMMPFVESLLPRLLKFINWETRHVAGTLERVFALCISCGIVEGKFRHLIQLKGVSHNDSQHSADALRGIKEGCAK